MKFIYIFFFCFSIFLLGCLSTQNPVQEDYLFNEAVISNSIPIDNSITVKSNDNISIIEIKAKKIDNRWEFPLENYEKEFVNAGLYSEGFIKLTKEHISFLDNDEAVWLTPIIRNNTGILFNAIYTRELPYCKTDYFYMLGEKNFFSEPSLNNDDRWKISIETNQSCYVRVVISMNGYLSDLKNNDQISLFGNKNKIIFSFENLESNPMIKIVAVNPNTKFDQITESFVVDLDTLEIFANRTQIINENGITLTFNPPLHRAYCHKEERICPTNTENIFQDICYTRTTENCSEEFHIANRRVYLNFNDMNSWKILMFKGQRLVLGKEGALTNPNIVVFENDTITLDKKDYRVLSRHFAADPYKETMIICSIDNCTKNMSINSDTPIVFDNVLVQIEKSIDPLGFGSRVVQYDDVIDFAQFKSIYEEWDGNKTDPGLKSIVIPRASEVFYKLTK